MGLAIIVPNISFENANLGQVTLIEDVPLTAIQISGASVVNVAGNTAEYSILYTPANTTEKGVIWSIESGSAYATIDSNGILSVLRGASNSPVTIVARSRIKSNIVATKEITVTYAASLITPPMYILQKAKLEFETSGVLLNNSVDSTPYYANRSAFVVRKSDLNGSDLFIDVDAPNKDSRYIGDTELAFISIPQRASTIKASLNASDVFFGIGLYDAVSRVRFYDSGWKAGDSEISLNIVSYLAEHPDGVFASGTIKIGSAGATAFDSGSLVAIGAFRNGAYFTIE